MNELHKAVLDDLICEFEDGVFDETDDLIAECLSNGESDKVVLHDDTDDIDIEDEEEMEDEEDELD